MRNMNKTLRCNEYGNIYNFVDNNFLETEAFLISKNGDLSFLLNNTWQKHICEDSLYAIMYRNSQYIQLIKYLNV